MVASALFLKSVLLVPGAGLAAVLLVGASYAQDPSGDTGDPSDDTGDAATDSATDGAGAANQEWSYSGATGPAQWALLSEEYEACDGNAQSPIDITDATPDDTLGALDVSYVSVPVERDPEQYVTTFEVEDAGGFAVDGRHYMLVEFHFHTPSEHTVEGQRFAAEAHFVHEGEDGTPAVVAVMVEEGAANDPLESVLPGTADRGNAAGTQPQVDPGALLPESNAYYTYTGSLTTPPCTEGVRWFVLQEPVEASPEQTRQLKGEGTNRPVQPLNGRTVAASE